MGNSLPVPSSRNKLQEHIFIQSISQGKSLMRHKLSGKYIVTVQHTFPCEQLMNQYVRKNSGNMALQHQFYLNAHDYEILSQANICSKQFKIVQYFQYHQQTLKKEIQHRAQHHRQFTNKQIMSILCSVVLAMSYVSKLELLHYTLNPDDIIIDQDGICKVISSVLSNHSFDFNPDKQFYYAPETLKIFKLQTATNTITNKSAVYTLGMTLLSMIHLTDLHYIYNFSSYTINNDEINDLMEAIVDKDLKKILQKMLRYHSYQRITFTQLQEMLYQIISQNQVNGHKSAPCLQQEQHQISKLEESIVRIRQSQFQYKEQPTFNYKNSHVSVDTLPVHFFSQSVSSLPLDQEDLPTYDHASLPNTETQIEVIDEDDKGKQLQSFSRRQSLASSYSKAHLNNFMHESDFNRRKPLMQNSNYSNHSQQEPRISHPNHSSLEMLYMKQNKGYAFSSGKKDIQPEYVTEFFKEGKYQGYKVGKCRQGFGTFYYNQGGKYCGQWSKNRMQGRGVLYYSSGKLAYEGQWQNDKLHGYGVLYNQKIQSLHQSLDFSHLENLTNQWIKYEGYFEEDMKHGQGTLFFSNGQYFRGNFEGDLPNGQGQFKNIRGEVIKGFWLMGALNQIQ